MRTRVAFTLIVAALPFLLPSLAAQAAPHAVKPAASAKPAAPAMYACSICHHQVSAAEAKKLHYTCPVDHGKLLPVKAARRQ